MLKNVQLESESEFELGSPGFKSQALFVIMYHLSSLSITMFWLTKITFLAINIGKFSVQGFVFIGVLKRSMKCLVIYVDIISSQVEPSSFFSDTRTVVRYMDPYTFFCGLIIVCIVLLFSFLVLYHWPHASCHISL